jgi:2-haloacid dehalogenase
MLRPRYITFDCYGTLTNFRLGQMTRERFPDRIPADRMEDFVSDFSAYRLDEVMGEWKPYRDVLRGSLERVCRRWKIESRVQDADSMYAAVPTWGPHPDVAEPLARIARHIPLVILSNAANEQIQQNVAKLGAPFHAVYTAEQARAYKPRLRAFEFLLDQLGCGPEEILHVSSSPRYDLMSAHDMGIRNKAYVARGHEPPPAAGYECHEIRDIGGLPALVGL